MAEIGPERSAISGARNSRTSKVGVVDLNVPDPSSVQNLQLLLVSLCDVGKVLLVTGIDIARESPSGTVAEVVPRGGNEGELDVLPLALGHVLLHDLDLVGVTAVTRVANLAHTDSDGVGDVLGLQERLDVGSVGTEHRLVVALHGAHLDVLHAVELLEEGTPEHVARVLAAADSVETALLLELDNVCHGLVLERSQLGL